MTNDTHRREDIRVAVTLDGQIEPVTLAATLHLPAAPAPDAPMLFLFPGAGYNRRYFDLQLSPGRDYSEAAHHVASGMIVVAMDHLAAGNSSLPGDADLIFPLGDDVARTRLPGPLTFAMMADACAAGVRIIRSGLADGSLVAGLAPLATGICVALGQSMGGHVLVATQAAHASFDAIGALGTSFTQTRLTLRSGARYPFRTVTSDVLERTAQTESDMAACFHWPDEPAEFVQADMAPAMDAPWRSKAIPGCSARGLLPGAFAAEAGAIRVPMLLAYGEIDVSPDPNAEVAAFRSSSDILLTVIPEMAHMHNFAGTRQQLWRRIDAFVQIVASSMGCTGKGA